MDKITEYEMAKLDHKIRQLQGEPTNGASPWTPAGASSANAGDPRRIPVRPHPQPTPAPTNAGQSLPKALEIRADDESVLSTGSATGADKGGASGKIRARGKPT
jgi:hypothetical protein